SDTANELLRSPYEPTSAHERPGPERYNVENYHDLLRSSFAPKRARTQATVDAGVPAGEDAAPRAAKGLCEHREGYKPHLFAYDGASGAQVPGGPRLNTQNDRLPKTAPEDVAKPERLRPAPAMTRRDKLRQPLVGVLIAAMLAAPIGYYITVDGWGPSSE